MAMAFRYVPPKIDARLAVHAVLPLAETAGAEVILENSQPMVPVLSGTLRDSGKVTHDGERAAVSYEGIAADGYDYGARQHEDMSLHHEQGSAKFLEIPMNSSHEAVREAVIAELAKVLL